MMTIEVMTEIRFKPIKQVLIKDNITTDINKTIIGFLKEKKKNNTHKHALTQNNSALALAE